MTSLVLQRPHTHAGKSFAAGEWLDVDGGTADWLIANGIARHDRQPVAAPTQPDDGDKAVEAKSIQRKESKS